MHIHIIGICGTFMGGIAVLAQQAGHKVTGCDSNVYPPMSTQLETLGQANAERFQLRAHGWIDIAIAAGDFVACLLC